MKCFEQQRGWQLAIKMVSALIWILRMDKFAIVVVVVVVVVGGGGGGGDGGDTESSGTWTNSIPILVC
jgi:hypothetical protein